MKANEVSSTVWPYLVNDFLEMACFLTESQREFLLQKLSSSNITAHQIDVHPCFSIQDRMIIVAKDIEFREYWLYSAERRQIVKGGIQR